MSVLNFKPVIRRPHPLLCGHMQTIYKFNNKRGASVLEGSRKISICPIIYLSDDPEDFTLESKEHTVDRNGVANVLESICRLPEIVWPVMHKERRA